MRNQPLVGYLLHHKPYQESRGLYYFFTPTHGLIHGVGKKGMPLFALIELFATGKRSLKSFSQIQPAQTNLKYPRALTGQNLYAGFYLNEILWKLLETEDAMEKLWQYYQLTIERLSVSVEAVEMRLILRHFELALFESLGYGFSLKEDIQGNRIQGDFSYQFIVDQGFQSFSQSEEKHTAESESELKSNPQLRVNSFANMSLYSGSFLRILSEYLQVENQTLLSKEALGDWSRLHKQMIDHLLDYQLLNSRELWMQFMRYQ